MAAIELHYLSLQNPKKVQTFSMSHSLSIPSTSFSISSLKPLHHFRSPKTLGIRSGLREIRARIDSVKSTQKITEAMKLVAAARVRRAQEAVVNGRPFAQTLADLFRELAEIHGDSKSPLTNPRPAKKIAVVVFTTDRGLCGGLNAAVVKKAENRISELQSIGLECRVISVGKKGNSHFRRRYSGDDEFRCVEVGSSPTAKEAQVIADILFSMFFAEEVDKIELVYTKFVSLLKFEPVVQTLLPLKKNEIVDSLEDESFRLTSKEGKLSVERESSVRRRTNSELLPPILEFEQDPDQILDAMLPLYLNSQVLRVLQESMASELASRMNAMSSATENANELGKSLSRSFNRQRQAKITGEILEIVAGAEALRDLD